MGLRVKVTLTFVIIALIQIACRHCMPSTSRKASLNRYLNDLKHVKNNPIATPYSPSRVNITPKQRFGKTVPNGRISQNSPPKKSLYKTYNFPENEYPLDNSPRDPFRLGMNFNDNNHVSTLQKARDLQNTAINDLKKEMKMKRKLLSNKKMNNYNSQLNSDMSSIKFAPKTNSMRLLDSETFPEVQYPLNTMETWGPNYWSYLQFPQEKQCNRFEQQPSNFIAKDDMTKPITRLTKAKASKFLLSFDKLKEEHRRTSTENSKRSNAGQKGLNFTKTATCERVSDDFITEGLVSKVHSKPIVKKTLELTTDIAPSLENTCLITDYPYHPMPIPYKVIENNTEDTCPALELKNNTKGLQDLDTNVIAQTLQLIEEILFHDDATTVAPLSNFSRETEKEVFLSDFVSEVQANKDVPTTLIDSTKNCILFSTEDSSQEVPDEVPAGILQDKMPSLPAETIRENTTAIAEPLNVTMPLPLSEPITNEEHLTVTNPCQTNVTPLLNSHSVPATTSIIIIPINNNDFGKSQSHMFETTSSTPIIVYLPSTQTSGIPSQTQNQIVSSSFDNAMPNNKLNNVLSNMTPLQNNNPFSAALVSELLNRSSDSGSSLPMIESLPTNSMCYNNESRLSSMKEKLISEIVIHKSLTDDAPPITKICEVKLSQHPTETANFDMNPDTLPQTPDFEHPLFDFADGELTSLSHGPYNNVLDNELPILAREINSAQQISNVHSKDLFFPKQNVPSEYLHKRISKGFLPEITNDVSSVSLDKNFSSESLTDNIPESNELGDELPPAPLIDNTVKQSLPTEATFSSFPPSEILSVHLPEKIDPQLTHVPGTITDNPSSSLNFPVTTDVTIKTELYKIRQILDKMLSSQIPTDIQTAPVDTVLSPISDIDRLPLLDNQSLLSIQTQTEGVPLSAADKTPLSVPAPDLIIERLPLKEYETFSPFPVDDRTLTDILPLSVDKHPNSEVSTNQLPMKMVEIQNFVSDVPVSDLPIMVHQERTKTPKYEISTNDLPMQVIEPQNPMPEVPVNDLPIMVYKEPIKNTKSEVSTTPLNPLPDVQVSDLLNPTDALSMPEGAVLPDVSSSSESHTAIIRDHSDKVQQDFPPSTVHPSEEEQKHKVDCALSTAPDAFANEPFLSDDLPSSVNDEIAEVLHTTTDTKDLPFVVKKNLLPEDDTNPNILVIDIPRSINNGIQSTYLDDTCEKISESTFSDIPRDDLPLRELKILPLTDNTSNNKIPTTSKLPITKALLEIVLSDIMKGGLSSSVTKLLPVTPSQLSPLSEAKQIPPEEEHLGNEISDNQTDILPVTESIQGNFKFPVDETHSDNPILDLPLQMRAMYLEKPDIMTDDAENLSFDKPSDDIPLPSDKVSLPIGKTSLSTKNTPSVTKLPITKAVLENVLSGVTSKDFSLPVPKALPVKSTSMIDKTLYNVNPPVSETTLENYSQLEDEILSNIALSDHPTYKNLPFSGQSEVVLPLDVDVTLSDVTNLDDLSKISTYGPMDKALLNSNDGISSSMAETFSLPKDTSRDLQLPNTQTHLSSKITITKALLENMLTDINTKGFTIPVAKSLPIDSRSKLDKTLYYIKSPHSDINKDRPPLSIDEILSDILVEHSDHLTDYNFPFSGQSEGTVPSEVDEKLSEISSIDISTEMSTVPKSNENISSPMAETFPLPKDTPNYLPSPNTKTPSSSKLRIATALLQNVLSDIKTKGFSIPVAKSLPIDSSSKLDKTLHYTESPHSDINKERPPLSIDEILSDILVEHSDHLTDYNFPFSGQSEGTVPSEVDEKLSEVSSLDISTEMSTLPKSNENISSPMAETFPLPKDTPNYLPSPNTKTPSSSKLRIATALLENVLSDIKTKGFSLSEAKSLPVESHPKLDKTLYYIESTLSEINEESPSFTGDEIIPNTALPNRPTGNSLAFSDQSGDACPLDLEEKLSDITILETPTEISSLMEKALTNSNEDISSPMAKILPLSKDTPSNLPLTNTKTPSTSKLKITKAVLENVLSDINTKGFSVPVATSLPVESRSQLDKSLYFMDPPLSDLNEDSARPDILTDNFPYTEKNERITELPVEDLKPEYPDFDMDTDELPIEEMSELSEEEYEEFYETYSDNPIDYKDDLSTQMDELFLSDNLSHNRPLLRQN